MSEHQRWFEAGVSTWPKLRLPNRSASLPWRFAHCAGENPRGYDEAVPSIPGKTPICLMLNKKPETPPPSDNGGNQ